MNCKTIAEEFEDFQRDRMMSDPALKRLYEFKINIIDHSMPILRLNPETKTLDMVWPPKVQALLDHADWCIQAYLKSTYNIKPING